MPKNNNPKKVKTSLSNIEKEIISLRKTQIKEHHSFFSKTFFTIISIIFGAILLYFKNGISELNKYILSAVIFGIVIFILQVWGTNMDLKKAYDKLMTNIIYSKNLQDYRLKKTTWFNKIIFGSSVGLLTFLGFVVITESPLFSSIIGLIFAIVFTFAPRHF